MEDSVSGLHHITAIAGDPQQNFDFYTKTIGLRMVKKTVNFDDPQTYHFYYGDQTGTPGSILTFFPWPKVRRGRYGSGMATATGFSVPGSSLKEWLRRFEEMQVEHGEISEKFGGKFLPFRDPDGLQLELNSSEDDLRKPWLTGDISPEIAIRGFHNVSLTVKKAEPTAAVLTEILGYKFLRQEGNVYRFISDFTSNAALVDIIEIPDAVSGINAGGTNHHVAFRVKDDEVLMKFREKVLSKGMDITPKIDRDYFFSLYFREPGGILFELATDNPGFTVDETQENLGSALKLPKKYERAREQIEKLLPELKM
ncbi:MAG TPA: ring-cleaving dioxygenase [Salinimicrobium sp.]|nr:ring-cleaving dioxygenase [Salinimicrobium sp.]